MVTPQPPTPNNNEPNVRRPFLFSYAIVIRASKMPRGASKGPRIGSFFFSFFSFLFFYRRVNQSHLPPAAASAHGFHTRPLLPFTRWCPGLSNNFELNVRSNVIKSFGGINLVRSPWSRWCSRAIAVCGPGQQLAGYGYSCAAAM